MVTSLRLKEVGISVFMKQGLITARDFFQPSTFFSHQMLLNGPRSNLQNISAYELLMHTQHRIVSFFFIIFIYVTNSPYFRVAMHTMRYFLTSLFYTINSRSFGIVWRRILRRRRFHAQIVTMNRRIDGHALNSKHRYILPGIHIIAKQSRGR